ncbi:MAG: MMPL family transporter [Myxococcota bacterium]
MLTRYASLVLKFRWIIIAVSSLVFVASTFYALQLPTNFSFEQFFPEDDEDAKLYAKFLKDYNVKENNVLIALSTHNILDRQNLTTINTLTSELSEIEGVKKVTSLANVEVIHGNTEELWVGPAIGEKIPETENELAELKSGLLENELIAGLFLSRDLNSTLIVAELEDEFNFGGPRKQLLKTMRVKINEICKEAFKIHIGGIPAMRSDYISIIENEAAMLFSSGFIILVLILYITFRNWQGIVLPISVVLFSVSFTLGAMKVAGGNLNIMTHILPILILIVGVSNSIHFIGRFYYELEKGKNKRESLIEAIIHLTIACFMTSITTAVGFAVLITTNIKLIQHYGLFAALGVIVSFVITITLLPSLLFISPLPHKLKDPSPKTPFTQSVLQQICALVTNHPKKVVVAFIITAALSGYFAAQLESDAKILEDLDESHPIVETNRFIEEKLGGVIPLEVLITLTGSGDFLEPQNLFKLEEFQKKMLSHREIGKILSFLDYLKAMNGAVLGLKNAALPQSREATSQLLLLLSGGDRVLKDFITPDYKEARISARLYDVGELRGEKIYAGIRNSFNELWGSDATLSITGTSPVAHKINRYIVNNIFWSFILAFGIITIMITILLRSPYLALLSLIPNIIPLLVTLGIMGAVGVPLKPSTAIIFSIAFGIAVDDTIHYLVRYISEIRQVENNDTAIESALKGVGRAMIYTSVVLVVGFSSALMSQIKADQNFAFLSMITISAALFGDLLLLPALLKLAKPNISIQKIYP